MLYGDFNAIRLAGGNKALEEVLRFWTDKGGSLGDGTHDLPDGMYAVVREYAPGPREEKRYESHIRYADVQCVLEGEEMIYVRAAKGLEVEEDLLEEKDVVFYRQPTDGGAEFPFLMRPGYFLFLEPEDVHKPECLARSAMGRKVVFKIPMTLL